MFTFCAKIEGYADEIWGKTLSRHESCSKEEIDNNNNVRSVQTKKQKPSSTGASFRQPGPDDLADMIPLPFLYLLIRGAANGVFNNDFGSRDNLCPESIKLLQHSREG